MSNTIHLMILAIQAQLVVFGLLQHLMEHKKKQMLDKIQNLNSSNHKVRIAVARCLNHSGVVLVKRRNHMARLVFQNLLSRKIMDKSWQILQEKGLELRGRGHDPCSPCPFPKKIDDFPEMHFCKNEMANGLALSTQKFQT